MSPNATVRIWWDTTVSAYRMTSPYKPELVTFLKQAIPASDRSFAPDTKIWTFSEKYLHGVMQVIETSFGSKPQLVSRAQAEKASSGSSTGTEPNASSMSGRGVVNPVDGAIITFFRLLPYDAALAAYRKAAMAYHPDRGGDVGKMTDLNAIWTRLEKDLFNR